MSWKLLLYIGLLVFGMILSRLGLFGEKVYQSMGKTQMACLMVLLFAMGLNLGMNEEIIRSLGTIGAKGVIFGIATVIFSVLFVHGGVRFFMKEMRR